MFDGIARHTSEGYAFQQRAAAGGFKQAVRERDEPFGDVRLLDVQGLTRGAAAVLSSPAATSTFARAAFTASLSASTS